MFHTILAVGNLGNEPEMRYTPSGQAVTTFSLATNRQYTNANGQLIKETTWFRVTVWGKMAETSHNYLHKGSKVLVEGRLQADSSTGGPRIYTRKDGTTGSSFEINASTVRFLTSRTEAESPLPEDVFDSADRASDDDVPF